MASEFIRFLKALPWEEPLLVVASNVELDPNEFVRIGAER